MRSVRSVVVSTSGQVTVPKEIRELLGIAPGDRVRFLVQGDDVSIVRQLSIADVAGSVKPRRKIEDFEKMIREAKEEHYDRRMRRLGM